MDKSPSYEKEKPNLSDKERILSLEKVNKEFQIQLDTIRNLTNTRVEFLTGRVDELESLFLKIIKITNENDLSKEKIDKIIDEIKDKVYKIKN